MGKMDGNAFPLLDAADDAQGQSQHLPKPVLGTRCLDVPTPAGLCPWVSTEVLAPF